MIYFIQLIIFVTILLFIVVRCIICYFKEKRDFNNGVCPNCGKPLKHFDDDSQGGQGWCCYDCNYFTWISWFKR